MSNRFRNFVLASIVSLCMWGAIIGGSISIWGAISASPTGSSAALLTHWQQEKVASNQTDTTLEKGIN